MFKKILIANRGEIACRVIKTARRMGISTVAIYSDADRNALHVAMADEAVHIGAAPASESYIVIDKVMKAVLSSGAEAVHPGYGFLSENKLFAAALEKAGVAFIGPNVRAIEAMGDKITSKKLAAEAGVSTVPGYMGIIADAEESVRISRDIGYPVMIKASAGGGGKGMRIAWNDAEAREGFARSKSEAASSFGDDRIFIEKFITQPRHIEIQVLGDAHGNCIHLNERECSIQRRNQKVIEEAPSSFLDARTRASMGAQAVALAKAVDYNSAGTVEFIVDRDRNFYFLEMNTRLQVEHPVTELITGVDLVEQMINVAAGKKLALQQSDIGINGWAMESRLYAEDPYRNFLPSIGRLTRYRPPQEVITDSAIIRNDTGVYEGGEISMFYDPMIAKLCSWAPDRTEALDVMRQALDSFELEGVGNNLPFLAAVIDHPKFISGDISTAFIEQEYPDGFSGVDLPDTDRRALAAIAAHIKMIRAVRDAQISGAMPNHRRRIEPEWVVFLNGEEFAVEVHHEDSETRVVFDDGESLELLIDWKVGAPLIHAHISGKLMTVKVEHVRGGDILRYRGAALKAMVLTPLRAGLVKLMPEKLPPDTSKSLLCPMPGLLVSLAVAVGDTVEAGQPLCTVEAMKMENVLRAENKVVVSKINAAEGDSLAVDGVIMEFE